MITLSTGQQNVFEQIMKWFATDEKIFVLGGYAGAGKTTLAQYIADAIDPDGTIFCAFTGKAANVLREKGCRSAGTLHSYLYALIDHDRQIMQRLEADIKAAYDAADGTRVTQLLAMIEEKRAAYRRPKFELDPESKLKFAPLVIVDEYSMLSQKLLDDIHSTARKVLYLGDPFQLPPVDGECSLQPTAFITEIHRQALESPIIRAATAVRKGNRLSFCDDGDFKYQPKRSISPGEYRAADQIIVGRNNTRTAWNDRFRHNKGIDLKELPRKGEKMICLKNEPFFGLFNGMIGIASENARNRDEEKYTLDFDDHYGLQVFAGDIDGTGHKYDGYNEAHRKLQRFDYAYAITCHKAQGSEFDDVLVYNEPIGKGEERARWTYTAITRAKKRCILVEP